MSTNQKRLAVLYWGRRGGGIELFNQLVRDTKLENFWLLESLRPTKKDKQGLMKQISALDMYSWIKARHRFVSKALEQKVEVVLIVMSSPWDMWLGRKLAKYGIEVIRVIHDGKPHKGEIFPSKFWIRLLTKDCSKVITLSKFVANELSNLYGLNPSRITVCQFPIPIIRKIASNSPNSRKKVLLIGRGKKYQGQELFEKASRLLGNKPIEMVIAGEGFKPNLNHPKIIYKNWWMSHNEFIEEIASSSLVIFPYIEASQSGTISICTSLGIPVIVTPIGGLPEQVIQGVTGLILTDTTPRSICAGIEEALNWPWSLENSQTIFLKSQNLIQSL